MGSKRFTGFPLAGFKSVEVLGQAVDRQALLDIIMTVAAHTGVLGRDLADICRQYLDLGAAQGGRQFVFEQDRQRIGFLPGRTAREPDFEAPCIRRFQALGQHVRHHPLQRFPFAEKTRVLGYECRGDLGDKGGIGPRFHAVDQVFHRSEALAPRDGGEPGFDQIGLGFRNRLSRPFQGQVCQLVEHLILHVPLRTRVFRPQSLPISRILLRNASNEADFCKFAFKDISIERFHDELVRPGPDGFVDMLGIVLD